MEATSPRWQAITDSEFPWEREALAFVRDRLSDHDPYRAWANFEFIADDGSINEVDLLVLTTKGFYLVEIKSRPGTVEGDQGTWTRTQRLRTLAELPFEAEFRAVVRVPVYQRIAAEGARMQDRGVTVAAIGRHFGVDDHTVDKAIRWFQAALTPGSGPRGPTVVGNDQVVRPLAFLPARDGPRLR